MSIVLGNKVRDIVTGVVGIATARAEYLNGCVQYCVQPKCKKDAYSIDSLWFDQGQLEVVDSGIAPIPKLGGGPQHAPHGIGRSQM